MKWEDLVVIAAQTPLSPTGVAIGMPIVRTSSGTLHLLRRVDTDAPVLGSPLRREEEYSRRIRDCEWLDLHDSAKIHARRDHLTLVVGSGLKQTLDTSGQKDEREWQLQWMHVGDFRCAYVDRAVLEQWRDACASAVLDWSERKILNRKIRHGYEAKQVTDRLRHVVHLSDEGTPLRLRMLLDLALIERLGKAPIPQYLESVAAREFTLSSAEFGVKVDEHGRSLLGTEPASNGKTPATSGMGEIFGGDAWRGPRIAGSVLAT